MHIIFVLACQHMELYINLCTVSASAFVNIDLSQHWKFRLTCVLVCRHWHLLNISCNAHTRLTDNCIRIHVVFSDTIHFLNSVQCIIPIAFYLCVNLKYMYSHFAKNHPWEKVITCRMSDYNSARLYEDAFNISYNWKKWLPPDVYRYHELLCKEVNAPVELQMGILLPFISSVCGPLMKGHFWWDLPA